MNLLATVLQMPVILPPYPSGAVPLGSAMLGRYAHHLQSTVGAISSQQVATEVGKQHGDELWYIMSEMTAQGERVEPRNGGEGQRERRLLEVKYKVFREAIEVQKRWRRMVDEAVR